MTEITRTVDQLVADIYVDDDGQVVITTTQPLTPTEARAAAALILDAATTGETYTGEQRTAAAEVVHGMPLTGHGVTTCCQQSPFALPRTDRVTGNRGDITCTKAS